MWRQYLLSLLLIPAGAAWCLADDAAQPQQFQHQITGLFAQERVQDLRELFKTLPQFKLVDVDFETAEATIAYDPAKAFPNAKANQVVEQFDNLLRNASKHTFGVKPLCTLDSARLKLVEIQVIGLDCKGCCLGAYDAIYRLKGVEYATASFKVGKVTARIDPEKIDRTELETALKQRGVQLQAAE